MAKKPPKTHFRPEAHRTGEVLQPAAGVQRRGGRGGGGAPTKAAATASVHQQVRFLRDEDPDPVGSVDVFPAGSSIFFMG